MPAYLLIETRVSDPAAYAKAMSLAALAMAIYGGRQLAGGGEMEVLEGRWSTPEHLVIIEFDSAVLARTFYNSAEYQAARAAAHDAAQTNILLVDGLPFS